MMQNGDTLVQYPPDVIDNLCETAKEKLTRHEQYYELFSSDGIWRFRLTGTNRLYAFRVNSSIFKVVWWDPDHKIYPTAKN